MTSNVGQEPLLLAARSSSTAGIDGHSAAACVEAAKQKCSSIIRASLRPELLNRLDDIIVFNPLTSTTLRSVVRLQLRDISRRLGDLDIKMSISDSAIDHALS